jgi:BioD-like phosphotransacetylase family protein
MPYLFVSSTGDHAGHSLVTWAIARRLQERGLSVGFLKPFGTYPVLVDEIWSDQDALLFKEVLHLQEPLERICPYLISEDTWGQVSTEKILRELKSLAKELSTTRDILLIMGSKHIFFDDTPWPIPDISLISELDAYSLIINRFRKTSRSTYSILSIRSLLKDRVRAIILNRVHPDSLQQIEDEMISPLSKKGVPITIAIPEDPFLSFRSLREIKEILDGELLWGEEKLDQPVGQLSVGSTALKGKLLIFKRVYNKIVLLQPLSLDPAMEHVVAHGSVAGILLTGGRSPAPQVIQAAKETDIPLMLVNEDTFGALGRLERITPQLSSQDEAKVRRFTELLESGGAFDRLLHSFGLPVS